MQARKTEIEKVGRLKKRSDFLRVRRAGRKWSSKGVMVQAAAGLPGTCRFGITVTRRVSKSAVKRNRIKRRLRAAACDVLPGSLKDGTDIVLIGRPETATRPYPVLKQDLKWCLSKLGCIEE